MAYQVKRSERIFEVLELTNEKGEVLERLEINIDIDATSTQFRKKMSEMLQHEIGLKAAREVKKTEDFDFEKYDVLCEAYGTTIISLFELTLGEENTDKIVKFFGEDYIEMAMQVAPFIFNVIAPKMQKSLEQKKRNLKRGFKSF